MIPPDETSQNKDARRDKAEEDVHTAEVDGLAVGGLAVGVSIEHVRDGGRLSAARVADTR